MRPLIIANWKMNPSTFERAKLLFDSVKNDIKKIKNVEVIICPPFVYLRELAMRNKGSRVKFGAQDCFWENSGAFTGEISPTMLKDLGVEYVIIGHSERRALGETDEMINKKIKAVFKAKLKPILCLGERKEELGETKKILKNQLEKAIKEIPNSLIIAYEPVWAIGTGNPCSPEKAKEILFFLKKISSKNLVLYGGSVNSENAKDYIKKAGFQGLLVGGASLDNKEFIKIVKDVEEVGKMEIFGN